MQPDPLIPPDLTARIIDKLIFTHVREQCAVRVGKRFVVRRKGNLFDAGDLTKRIHNRRPCKDFPHLIL